MPETPGQGGLLAAFGLTATAIALLAFYTWLAIPRKPPPVPEGVTITTYDSLFGVAAHRGGKMWIVGALGLILDSTDAGQTWKSRASGTDASLSSISFADESHGFAVGGGGTIVTTEDGGSHWQRQGAGVKEDLLAVQRLGVADAVAVGAYGAVVVTRDGGLHWRTLDLPWETLIPAIRKTYPGLQPNLNNLFFINRSTGWIVGEYGIILKTTDAGSTWIVQRAGEELSQLYAVVFTNPSVGWVVGQAGTLLHTTDGGATFHKLEVTGQDLYSIALQGAEGVIAGNQTLLLTRDGGNTWLPRKDLAVGTRLSQAVIESGRAIAVGLNGTILRLDIEQSIPPPENRSESQKYNRKGRPLS